jgi:hypothetical protein
VNVTPAAVSVRVAGVAPLASGLRFTIDSALPSV